MATIEIDTIQKLVDFSEGTYGRGTSSEYLDVVLTADLDFADLAEYDTAYNWAGCTGTWYVNFDGQGHKIDNIYYVGSTTWGFFNVLYGSIENLKLPNVYVTTTNNAIGGIVFQSAGAKITNCHISGHLETFGDPAVASICNTTIAAGTEVSFCSFSGLIKSTQDVVGLIGNCSSYGLLMYNCTIIADLTASGCAPFCSAGVTVLNCIWRGTAKCTRLYYGYHATLKNCLYIINQDSTISQGYSDSTLINCYYDNTLWPYDLSPLIPATTVQLKDSIWLSEHEFAI